jgi:acyl-CoA synthetase (AMP-forming)/AMP-acid ligase II
VRLKQDARRASGDQAVADELTAWCAAALAKFKVPKYVRFVEAFPMTASGKIQKYKLREAHQQLIDAPVSG